MTVTDTRAAAATEPTSAPAGWAAAWRVGLVALAVLSAFVGLRLALHDGDVSVFVLAGDEVTDPAAAPANLHVEPGVRGYDGQAFYRLARNPLTAERTEFGIGFARPEYRHQRIAYPAAAWLLAAGGREPLVPTALVVVNLLAGAAIAALAARIALDAGRSPWLGLIPAGWAGYLIALSLDLSEVLAGALLLAALLALRRERWGWAAASLVALGFTRETGLLLVAALLAVQAWDLLQRWRRDGERPWAVRRPAGVPRWVGVVPIVAYGAWRLALHAWWVGTPPTEPSSDFLTVPFVRLGQRLVELLGDPAALSDPGALGLLVTVAVVAVAAFGLAQRDAGRPWERLALLAFLLLFAASPVWDLDVTYLRWANDTVTVGWVLALAASRERVRTFASLTAVAFALTAAVWIPFP